MKTLALALLLMLSPGEESDLPYDREALFGRWADEDGDCRNTRHEVLEDHSLTPPAFVGCRVANGLWRDLYTGRYFTDAVFFIDIDHVVPLAEAWDSGAETWTPERRRAFANWPHNLLPVYSVVNRDKRADDPADWLPPDETAHCAYVVIWMKVKAEWGLTADARERAAIERVIEEHC